MWDGGDKTPLSSRNRHKQRRLVFSDSPARFAAYNYAIRLSEMKGLRKNRSASRKESNE
jgi:hypothetical protein